ncbi:hypothetical protein QVG61_04870 [Thiohalobacter sp. IOR34]|uniref:transporter n=1 Tax=Thiohalobacter sp. IOR34 TaxID=3057176 RepID=UPI0025B142AB|nr:transporter [Thiohalobacter sp. IOR34]WJW76430.1 hypothetical protein QVG61_04870 [Thiohalobacter sp. IOR34]
MRKNMTALGRYPGRLIVVVGLFVNGFAWAHDPIFGLGPHVLYQGGIELATGIHLEKRVEERAAELGLELVYGITGDWAAGIELPYAWKDEDSKKSAGPGDVTLFTKYRFWRRDSLGVQESAAMLLKLVTDTGNENAAPALGTGTTDALLGIAYGYESRQWYRWASLRYRRNGENDAGLRRGDKVLFDLVGGIRLRRSGYLEPDTVWLLELNGEYGQRAELNGAGLTDTGGMEWFLSPGVFWTKRNFALKAGVQIPIASDLNGNQAQTDYRAKLVLEWHQ